LATPTLYHDQQITLVALVRNWDRRLRLQQFVRWLALALMPGVMLGIALAVVSRMRPFLFVPQILVYALVGVGAGFGVLVIGVLLYPRSANRAAQQFDLMFRLNERVSTALDLIGGRIRASDQFTTRQLDDAIQRAQTIRAKDYLPIQVRWVDWVTLGILSAVLAALLLLPNPMEDNVAAATTPNPAIEEAADTLRDITEEIAADPSLSQEQRDSLLEELEASIDTLERDDITTEEAFAELSDVASELEDQAGSLGDQLGQQQQSRAGAQQALNGAFPEGEQRDQNDLNGDFETLDEQLSDIAELGENSQNPQSLADALNQAAEALRESNPEAAQALQDAAQALENGDPQAAQEAIQQAQDALDNQQQQSTQQQQSQQNLQQGADDTRQQQGALQQPSDNQPGGEQQAGAAGEAQDGQQAGEQSQFILSTPQPGEQADTQAQSGQQDGQQPGETSQSAQSGGNQPGQQGQPSQGGQAAQSSTGGSAGANSGAGDQDSSAVQQGFEASGETATNNNPDGSGVTEFDPIYAPQRAGGEGGPSISLESEDGDSPLVEGEFSENPTGQTTVPYNEVFSDYSNAASQALESDYIPLGMRDVVRDYFTSIEPGQ
jgi:hypothetical protein